MYIIKTKTLKQFYMGSAHIYLLFIYLCIYLFILMCTFIIIIIIISETTYKVFK